MSKIPQVEWSAIAARYAQGESISAIARTYGCTPPAIHYILKNNRRRTGERGEQPQQELRVPSVTVAEPAQKPSASAVSDVNAADGGVRIQSEPAPEQATAPVYARREALSQPAASARSEQRMPFASQEPAHTAGQATAGSDGLDSDLHNRAEVAIEAFRSSFEAALAEGSPGDRARLREAASNLMRVAARTTIVLDRLNALSERSGIDRGANNGRRI
jgi:transposase-like protein